MFVWAIYVLQHDQSNVYREALLNKFLAKVVVEGHLR
jgi:hypothetical protein